jgi:hypothetical protein
VDEFEAIETVARPQAERGLLGRDEYVERTKEIKIVAIDEQLCRRRQGRRGNSEKSPRA